VLFLGICPFFSSIYLKIALFFVQIVWNHILFGAEGVIFWSFWPLQHSVVRSAAKPRNRSRSRHKRDTKTPAMRLSALLKPEDFWSCVVHLFILVCPVIHNKYTAHTYKIQVQNFTFAGNLTADPVFAAVPDRVLCCRKWKQRRQSAVKLKKITIFILDRKGFWQ
jgi:hypothetical protein